MIKLSKRIIKKTLNVLGFDIVRLYQNPSHTLLGLERFSIRSIIDVGANEGQFAKMILSFFPDARIYCFEPVPDPFEKLYQWSGSQDGRVMVFNMALGESDGSAEMFYHLEHSPSSSMLKTTPLNEAVYPFTKNKKTFSVKVATLDKIVANLSEDLVPDVLIKLDVQGYEDRVIKGGPETFGKARACILEVSLDELYEKQATFKDILFLLHDLGFHYAGNLNQVYSPDDGHVIYLDAVFLKDQ